MNITAPALKRLQVLYGQYERHSLDVSGNSREERIAWAGARIGRKIATFKDLTIDEGISLIDGLQRALQVKAPNKTPRKRMDRREGEKAGTEGRGDQLHNETTLVSSGDLARIQNDLTRLGWDQARLEAFLRSSRSPLKGRQAIRTLADSNKLHWALKHIPARPSSGKEQLAAS